MATKLFNFLFGESQVDEELASVCEEIADIDTAGVEDRLKVDKKPLEKALEALDIDTEGLEHDPRGMSLVFSDADAYRAAHAILNQVENLHKLAQLGWVASPQGDVSQLMEPTEMRIRFLEIDEIEPQNEEPKPTKGTAKNTKLSAVIKKGREFASTKMAHDDEMNTVEYDDKGGKDHHKGMSKEKNGAQPEGHPKGSVKEAHTPHCDHCNVEVVNGVPTHEEGCPNKLKTWRYGRYQDDSDDSDTEDNYEDTVEESVKTNNKKKMSGLVKSKEGTISGTPKGSNGGAYTPSYDSLAATKVGKTKDGEAAKHAMKEGQGQTCKHCAKPLLASGEPECPHCGKGQGQHLTAPQSPVSQRNYPTRPPAATPYQGESVQEGKHKNGCTCGFCKNKGNIHTRSRPKSGEDSDSGGADSGDTTSDSTDMKEGLTAEEIVNQILEMDPSNPGTPPGITGHKSYPTMKVGSPDRKFAPAKGMVQPDSVEVNKQTQRKVKSI